MIQISFQIFGDDKLFDTIEDKDNFGDGIISFQDIQEKIFLETEKICQERGIKREDVIYSSPLCFPDTERKLYIFIMERIDSNFIENHNMAYKLSKIISKQIKDLVYMNVFCSVGVELAAYHMQEIVN